MKYLRRINRKILPLAVALSMVVPANASAAYSKDTVLPGRADYTAKDFIPFRNYIPTYLIQHSGETNSNFTKLWAKILYEERYWDESHPQFYDDTYTSWMEKYNDFYISVLDGKEKDLISTYPEHRIVYSKGDFEAAFGATIKNNPEFLGQLLNLPGYEPLGSDPEGNAYLKEVVTNYLKNPTTYEYFSKYIVDLTADGSYIGTRENNYSDNQLNVGDDNSNSLNVLITLSHYYGKKNGDENVLSDDQIGWVESFQEYLYDDYVKDPANSIAGKTPSIYNIIARSEDASNDKGGKGQEFFNYVEDSGEGIGKWLNQIDGVDIEGLDDLDSIELLFRMSNGFCYGYENEDKCTKHETCLPIENGGKATKIDKTAYLLHKEMSKNALVNKYIKSNSNVNNAYQLDDESWIAKFNVHHDKTGASLYFNKNVYAASGGNAHDGQSAYTDWTSVSVDASCTATLTVSSAAFLPNARSITVQCSCSTRGGIYGYSVYSNGVNLNYKCGMSGSTVYIADLTPEERQNAVLYVNLRASDHGEYNAVYYNEKHTAYDLRGGYAYANADISSRSDVIVSCKRSKCVINGHVWGIDETKDIQWADDLSSAVVSYTCVTDENHKNQVVIPTTKVEKSDCIVYTISTLCGDYEYTVYKSTVDTDTISLESDDNTFFVNSGAIKPGAKSIQVNTAKGQSLSDLTISVYSQYGELMASNNSRGTTVDLTGIPDEVLINCKILVQTTDEELNTITINY